MASEPGGSPGGGALGSIGFDGGEEARTSPDTRGGAELQAVRPEAKTAIEIRKLRFSIQVLYSQ